MTMTEQHPITPPFELVDQWSRAALGAKDWLGGYDLEMIATQAARWGSDQELEECCNWVDRQDLWPGASSVLRSDRRLGPFGAELKDQAFKSYERMCNGTATQVDHEIIRRVIDALPEN